MRTRIDFTLIAAPAAQCLLGEPNWRLSRKRELRWGSKGSFALNLETGQWYDHESGEGGGVLALVARELGLERPAALDWLRGQGFISGGRPVPGITRPRRPAAKTPHAAQNLRRERVLELWAKTTLIPTHQGHPARCWAAQRHLWREEVQWPPVMRWLDARQLHRQHTGAGAVAALFAPLAAWRAAWPGIPPPHAVELIHVAADGSPCLDRSAAMGGLGKRTHGQRRGTVCMVGNPADTDVLNLTEGVADMLALGSRCTGTALGTGGVSGFEALAPGLAGHPAGVRVCSDADEAGQRQGAELVA